MPRDYAKKKPKKKRGASRKKKASAPILLWLITIVAVCALVAGLVYLKWFQPNQSSPPIIHQPNEVKSSQKKVTTQKKADTSPAQTNPDDIPIYDLHEELINKEVRIPAEDLKLPYDLDKYYYLMPCGSFKNKTQADELKARIGMAGYPSTIIETKANGATWYRVQLGSFSRKRKAERVRHRLQDNNIIGCIIYRHVKKD